MAQAGIADTVRYWLDEAIESFVFFICWFAFGDDFLEIYHQD